MQKASSQDMDWMLQAMLRMYGRDEEAPADGYEEAPADGYEEETPDSDAKEYEESSYE